MFKLSDRLELIYSLIGENETMADIGTDHGFLPIALWERGKCKNIILCDINEGPLKKAEENIIKYKSTIPLDLRLGSGLNQIENKEVDTIVIAGMGGSIIIEILKDDIIKAKNLKKIILQPRNNQGQLRKWLENNGFVIVKEELAREVAKICEVIQAEYSSDKISINNCEEQEIYYELPRIELVYNNPLIKEFILKKIRIEENIINNINIGNNSGFEKNKEKSNSSYERIKYLENYLRRVDEFNGNE